VGTFSTLAAVPGGVVLVSREETMDLYFQILPTAEHAISLMAVMAVVVFSVNWITVRER
jgi:hypothetical protein